MEEHHSSSWKEALISRLVLDLKRDSVQRRPYFPDLLHQPDLLTIPKRGKLTAVFAYNYRISWTTILASLEDLFETKIHVGEHTAVVAFLAPKRERHEPFREGLELLRNTFDSFLILDEEPEADNGHLRTTADSDSLRERLGAPRIEWNRSRPRKQEGRAPRHYRCH